MFFCSGKAYNLLVGLDASHYAVSLCCGKFRIHFEFDEETVLLGRKRIVHMSVKDAFGRLMTGWHLANGHGLCVLELDGIEVCINRKVLVLVAEIFFQDCLLMSKDY